MNQSAAGGSRRGQMEPPPGLARYGSAPGSFLSNLAESVIAGVGGGGGGGGGRGVSAAPAMRSEAMMTRFYSNESPCLASESSYRVGGQVPDPDAAGECPSASYGSAELHAPSAGPPLVRHSSLPSGFSYHLLADHGMKVENLHDTSLLKKFLSLKAGISTTSAMGNYSQTGTESVNLSANGRLRSQWSFSRQDSLSQISELIIPEVESETCHNSDEAPGLTGQSYMSGNFQLGPWDDTNPITFSAPPREGAKDNNGDIVTSFSNIDSQFSLPRSSEMSELEKYFQIQQDSVPCRVRAKRGCATHPRSIAERERRTRISKRLHKLQDLVPNMDKQTSTSDMLELAIQHIKELQSQIQRLKEEQANCTCSGRQEKI